MRPVPYVVDTGPRSSLVYEDILTTYLLLKIFDKRYMPLHSALNGTFNMLEERTVHFRIRKLYTTISFRSDDTLVIYVLIGIAFTGEDILRR